MMVADGGGVVSDETEVNDDSEARSASSELAGEDEDETEEADGGRFAVE